MTKLHGLIVCGGKSTRMGIDKGMLQYHGQPQQYYLYDMLEGLCERVFISCSEHQAAHMPAGYHVITDATQYKNVGPMAALLSAFKTYPGVSFLMVGCDYPFLKKEDIKRLIDARDEKNQAVSYFNQVSSIREPLLAVYETGTYPLLLENYYQKKLSLRFFLDEINAKQVLPTSQDVIASVDTPEAYREAIRKIRG